MITVGIVLAIICGLIMLSEYLTEQEKKSGRNSEEQD